MSWTKLGFERLLDAAHGPRTALKHASASDLVRECSHAGHLWRHEEQVS